MDLDRFFCFSIAYKRIRNGQELNFHRRLTRDGRELATPLLFLAFTKDISSGSARFLLSSSTKRNKKKKEKEKGGGRVLDIRESTVTSLLLTSRYRGEIDGERTGTLSLLPLAG